MDDAIAVLNAIGPVAGTIPVVGTGVQGLLIMATRVCEIVKETKVNREEYENLAKDIAEYASAVSRAVQSSPPFSPGFENTSTEEQATTIEHVNALKNAFEQVAETIERRKHEDNKREGKFGGQMRQGWYTIRKRGKDKEDINNLRAKIQKSIEFFQLGAHIHELESLRLIERQTKANTKQQKQDQLRQEREATERRAAEQARKTIEDAKAVREAEERRQDRFRQAQEYMEKKLAPVLTARFDAAGAPEGCLPNTRKQLLAEIHQWLSDNSKSSADIFCVTGLAGTGKSTIAQSVCIRYKDERPGANFIITRSVAERRDPAKILQTIVYQLALQKEAMQTAIDSVLRNGPDVVAKPLSEQVPKLFTEPLKAILTTSTPPVLIVIDGLDECDMVAGCEGGDLIPLIIAGIQQLSHRVKMLITSREEPAIMTMIKCLKAGTLQNQIRLQNIGDSVVKADIKAYFTHHLRIIAEKAGLETNSSWPSKGDLDLLVEQTGKLFVYAALVVKLLAMQRIDPKKRLEEILHSSSTSASKTTFHQLDKLYLVIMEKATAFEDGILDEDVLRRVRQVVASLVLLQSPQNIKTLSKLLNESFTLIQKDIEHLSAVLIIPDNYQDPVTIFHPSFADFVLIRCSDPRFQLDLAEYHLLLAQSCLSVMNQLLKQNICNIQDISLMNNEIDDLKERRNHCIPPELQYACEYWVMHLSHVKSVDDRLRDHLHWFCTHHLLHWVEVLSLLGKLSTGQQSTPEAIKWCKQSNSIMPDLIALLEDIEQTMQVYDNPIQASALQIYQSCLKFMPSRSLFQLMKNEVMGPMHLMSKQWTDWPLLRRIIEGHTNSVLSVTFSADGTLIASGSSDNSVRVWDAITGSLLLQFEGHTHNVRSVAFSTDGKYIVSGSDDTTVRVWNTSTGSLIAQLEGHTGNVRSVAFSADGTCVVSGSDDDTIRVWDAFTGSLLTKLENHTNYVTSVAFSTDRVLIASGTFDHSVKVWDAITGSLLAQLEGHTDNVRSVTFSADRTRIASGSDDKTIRVWDAITSNMLAQPEGHTDYVRSVAFSSNRTWIASGSDDKTVQLWDATTGNLLAQLKGHTDFVRSVAFSADGTHIVSGSDDTTVRVWNTSTGSLLAKLEGHTDYVRSVAFSADGAWIVSGSFDKTVRVWDAVTGCLLAQLEGHTNCVTSVAFSADGLYIASGSFDRTVQVWDAINGSPFVQLEGHTHCVVSVAFSTDGMRIVSGSYDKTVRVWDTITGCPLAQLAGHTQYVRSVMFSNNNYQIILEDIGGNSYVWHAGIDFPVPDAAVQTIETHYPIHCEPCMFRFEHGSGWLLTSTSGQGGMKCVCWIPPDRRGRLWTSNNVAVLFTQSGHITILSVD